MENKITPEMIEKTKFSKMSIESVFAEAESHALPDEELMDVTVGFDLCLALEYLRKTAPQNNLVARLLHSYQVQNTDGMLHDISALSLTYPDLWQDAMAYGSRGK